MTTHSDPDRLLAAYLGDGMQVLPDRVVDAVLAEVHQTSQRTVFGPRRTPLMNSPIKFILAAAAVVAVAIVGFNALMPGDGAQVGGPSVASPSPMASAVITPSPEPSPSSAVVPMTVAGTDVVGPRIGLTLELPAGWSQPALHLVSDESDPGTKLFFSVVDNTFSDPCGGVPRSPKVGSTVADIATALGEIPDTTASDPIQTTLAGYEATFLKLTLDDPLPCDLRSFYLWQDSPGNLYWPQETDEALGAWIVDVGGVPVVVATRTYPDTSDASRAELQQALDSIVFDAAP